ncbi:MAG: Xaa-Pro peptidase family protein [Bryobacterales bacterium]|nr:Xaa-Pro peptidase family protein [Bryobacterales bacterium]
MRRLAVLLLLVLPHGASRGLEREAFEVYHQRRRAVSEVHPDGLILLLGYERQEAQAVRSPFRQENNFYYLTGWNEPGAALLLIPAQGDGSVYRELLFLPPDDPSHEKWHGPRAAPDDADIRSQTGFERVLPISKLATRLSRAAKKRSHVYTLFPHRAGEGQQPEPDRREKLQTYAGELPIADIRAQLEAMRAVKSEGEIRLIRKAVDASIAAHIEAWRKIEAGLYEYQILGPMLAAMIDRGCLRPAYAPIIGSGPNSTALHYTAGRRRLEPGEVVVMDVGGEYAHYAADLTRTVPVDGVFNERQREIYDLVLHVQRKVIAAVKTGETLRGLTHKAKRYFDEAGREAVGEAMGARFLHGVGHSVGLGVHDPIDPSQPLKAGMVITIEPGLYLPEAELGVRIEDMVLVTENGALLLSKALPKEADEIEKLMRGH